MLAAMVAPGVNGLCVDGGRWMVDGVLLLVRGAATNLVSCARSAHHPAEPNYRSHTSEPLPCLSCRPMTDLSRDLAEDDAGSPVLR